VIEGDKENYGNVIPAVARGYRRLELMAGLLKRRWSSTGEKEGKTI